MSNVHESYFIRSEAVQQGKVSFGATLTPTFDVDNAWKTVVEGLSGCLLVVFLHRSIDVWLQARELVAEAVELDLLFSIVECPITKVCTETFVIVEH